MNAMDKRELYCITCAPRQERTYEFMAEEACAGGAEILQFRHTGAIDIEIMNTVLAVRDICRRYGVLFIINDYPKLACDVDADGVHLGQDDMPVSQARHVLGPEKLIGLSTNSYEQAMKAQLQGADYIGFGPVFSTPTKPAHTPVGMDGIGIIARTIGIPVFVIGGITHETVSPVVMAGADRVAVVRAVCGGENIRESAAAMREHITQAKKERMYQKI